MLDAEEETLETLEEAETDLRFSVLLQLCMLFTAFMFSYYIKRSKFPYLQEAGASLLLGVVVGCAVEFSKTRTHFKNEVNFSEEVFFLFLLPPIIFESGYNLDHTKAFFGNFGAICMLAFLGTALSTLVVGLLVGFASWIGIIYPFSLLEALLFGSLISATDPVTVLSVFQELSVNVDLYCLVFGESVLNDAVAIVLYRTLATFTTATVTMGSMVGALGMFFIIFTGSVAIGGILALCLALLFKHTHFRTDPDLHYMETCLVVLVPYMSYTLAEAFSLSGIVSILFCGITMAHYMRPNLSPWSQAATKNIFKTLALLAETFVFVYMGMAAFLSNQKWTAIPFTLVAILGMVLGRAANVYPNVYLINRWRHPSNHIPEKHSMMLNISGLRGAIAFALALNSPAIVGEETGEAMLTCTLIIVLLTVLVIGGATPTLVDHFHLKEEIHNGSQADEDETSCMESVSQEGVPEGRVSRTPLMDNVTGMVSKLSDAASFDLINGHFLKPLFHRTDIHDDCTPPRNVELTTLGTLTEQTATTSTSPPP